MTHPCLLRLLSKYKDNNGVPYNPSDDNKPKGPITIRSAIETSQNLVAVKLEDQIGVDTGYDYAKRFGLSVTSADKNIATMALGQFSGGRNSITHGSRIWSFRKLWHVCFT